jgi:predicted enzyme related to lactoylglutathione lyase
LNDVAQRELRQAAEEGDAMAGQVVHFEIPAGDTAKAREFWGGLFGWEFQEFPGPTEYHMAQITEATGAAIYGADGDKRGTRAYFDVDEINAGRSRVQELGGQAAICTHTVGNEFGLWQNDPPAA